MTERRYMPSEYMDEAVPPARPLPTHWIVTLPGDRFALASSDNLADDDTPGRLIEPGEVVAFDWTESYGSITITIFQDGSFTSDHAPDARANCVWIKGDHDSLSDSVADFSRDWIGSDGPTGTVEVEQYAWSPKPESYRFDLIDGVPRFVRVEA